MADKPIRTVRGVPFGGVPLFMGTPLTAIGPFSFEKRRGGCKMAELEQLPDESE